MNKRNHTVFDYLRMKLRNIRIRSLSMWLLVLGCLFFGLSILGSVLCICSYKSLIKYTDKYVKAQSDIQVIMQSSNFLTENARQYVVTMDLSCLEAYFSERNDIKSRDRAIESLRENLCDDEEDSLNLLVSAVEQSCGLEDLEIHSMKLISLIKGYAAYELPDEVWNYVLPESEKKYNDQEMLDLAYYLVFDQNYINVKRNIQNRLEKATKQIGDYTKAKQNESISYLRNSLINQITFTVILLILIVIAFIVIDFFVRKPLTNFISNIRNNEKLKVFGVFELKYLAKTYNNMYEMNKTSKQELQHLATYDVLTGILNRMSFEQLCAYFKGSEHSMAFLLIDVDNFKTINDQYGHEAGDIALKTVASLLQKSFRADDYVMRIGGDEFAVFMLDIFANDKSVIANKIDNINKILTNPPKSDFPRLSISVGVSFSDCGYSNEMFKYADLALYKTKNAGRCGCSFYI